jgi:hypothetical protein
MKIVKLAIVWIFTIVAVINFCYLPWEYICRNPANRDTTRPAGYHLIINPPEIPVDPHNESRFTENDPNDLIKRYEGFPTKYWTAQVDKSHLIARSLAIFVLFAAVFFTALRLNLPKNSKDRILKVKEYDEKIKKLEAIINLNAKYKDYIVNPKIQSGRLSSKCGICNWEVQTDPEYKIVRECPKCGGQTCIELIFGGVTICYNPGKDNYKVYTVSSGSYECIDNADCPDTLAFMLKTLKYNRL